MAQANTNISQQTQEEPGYHEVEVLESCDVDEETQLHQKKDDCKKNPKHEKFIPVEEFNIQHLPEGRRDQLYLDYIRALINLTIRLVVNFVSCDRPDDIKYPLSKYRGKRVRTFGSGMVKWVEKFTDKDGKSCPCPQCEKVDDKDRKKQWGKFLVQTAKHVVFDDQESRHTQVDVDYNTDTDLDTCPKLHGVEVEFSKMAQDECCMYVVSHDRDVCLMLEERIKRYRGLREKLLNRGSSDFNNPAIVCVSHPHGMSKHVSVGEYKGQEMEYRGRWRYTASTCPGSSGAPVHSLGNVEHDLGHFTLHSGNSDGLNESCKWGGPR